MRGGKSETKRLVDLITGVETDDLKIQIRDLLWCRAILESGIDPKEMVAILSIFETIRPDRRTHPGGQDEDL